MRTDHRPLKPTAVGQKWVLGAKFQSVNLQNWRFIAIDRCCIDFFFFVCVRGKGEEKFAHLTTSNGNKISNRSPAVGELVLLHLPFRDENMGD